MKGYVVRKGNQHYAVIYEGLDPTTGRNGVAGIRPDLIETKLKLSPTDSRSSGCATDHLCAAA